MKLYIAYTADENYIQHVTVSIKSLVRVAKNITRYEVYLLANSLSKSTIVEMQNFTEKNHLSFHIIGVDNLKGMLPKNINLGKLGITAYLRLFLADLLPQFIDKVLYLDCDTVIMQDLSYLLEYPMDDYSVCGVEDTMPPEIREQTGLGKDDSYINAGVLLINLKKWRDANMSKRFISFINQFNGKVPFGDQGVINGVLREHGILSLAYNVHSPVYAIHRYNDLLRFFSLNSYYSRDEVKRAKNNPIILHYTALFVERPWFRFCLHPQKKYYRNLSKETPFAKNRLHKNQYGWRRKIKMLVFIYMQPLYFVLKYCKVRILG